VLGEYLDLPFKEFAGIKSGLESRRLQPDAMLEDPAARRRFFIEYETGSATVRDAKKSTSTSTMAKLDRYANFLTGYAGNVLHGERDTFYTRAFKDAWPVEVLFVAASEARRDSIAELIRERGHSDRIKIAARSMTLAEAQRYLRRAVYGAERPPGSAQPAEGRAPRAAETPARIAAEERLRPGRVAVRGEQLVNFEKAMRASFTALARAQEALTRLHVSPEAIPKLPASAPGMLRVLAEYARRGEEALSRYGLTVAE
jgi:hypothetical protein